MRSGIAASAVHGREESRVLGAANQCQHQERRVQTEFAIAESRLRRRRRQGFAVIFGEALGREERDGRELQRLRKIRGSSDVDEKIRELSKNRDQLDAPTRAAVDLWNSLRVADDGSGEKSEE